MNVQTTKRIAVALSFTLVIMAILGLFIGNVPLHPKEILQLIRIKLTGAEVPVSMRGTEVILFKLRLPRTLMMIFSGAALAGSGAAYQGLFRNPLADPYLIGISSGAGLGAIIAMTIPWKWSAFTPFAQPLFAFVLGTICVFIVVKIGCTHGTDNTGDMILAGIALNAFTSAVTSAWMLFSGKELRSSFSWMMGGKGTAGWDEIFVCGPCVFIGLIGLIRCAYPLNLLQYGEEQAAHFGLSVERVQRRLIFFATLTTASAIAFSGIIGFVGLIVPHLLRIWVGGDYRKLIPLSIIGGSLLLCIADIFARVIIAPLEVPVGIITALLGAPFFLWLLQNNRKGKMRSC